MKKTIYYLNLFLIFLVIILNLNIRPGKAQLPWPIYTPSAPYDMTLDYLTDLWGVSYGVTSGCYGWPHENYKLYFLTDDISKIKEVTKRNTRKYDKELLEKIQAYYDEFEQSAFASQKAAFSEMFK